MVLVLQLLPLPRFLDHCPPVSHDAHTGEADGLQEIKLQIKEEIVKLHTCVCHLGSNSLMFSVL